MKKIMVLTAVMVLVVLSFAPLVMAQQEAPPAPAAPPQFFVGCQILANDPLATCPVDENGFITFEDGSTAQVVIEPDGTTYTVGEDGSLTVIGQGEPLFPEEEPEDPGLQQYEPAQGPALPQPAPS